MTTPAPLMAEELMIGNYVYWNIEEKKGVPHKVISVSENGRIHTVPISLGQLPSDYSGIPLTEQWLKEFGFVELIQKTGYNTTEMVIYKPNEDSNYWRFIYNKWTVKIDYVHQLQNLYFALTTTKLERGVV